MHFLVNEFLLVQHGQLGKLPVDTPTPVTVMHDVLSAAIAAGEIPAQDPNLASALVMATANGAFWPPAPAVRSRSSILSR